MKIHTPKTSIFSCNSDRQPDAIDRTLMRLRSLGVGSAVGALAGAIGLLSAIAPAVQAQVPISGLGTSYQTGTTQTVMTTGASPSNGGYTSNAPYTLNFGSTTANDRYIQTFDTGTGAGLKRYNFGGLVSNIYIRRNEANFPGTNRQLGFFERSSPTSIISSYAPDMETILRSQAINRGTDNTFANQGNASGNNSNIERLDFVNTTGLAAPTDPTQINDIGFLILERGGNDSVKIAAITSIDATGKPTGYGPVVTQTSANWGKSGVSLDYAVMRKDATDPNWRPSDSGTQSIGGIYFSFGSLGVTPGTTIYGYSVIPADVTATSGINLTDWLQYPTTTPDTGTTGLDLMAGGGVFVTHTIKGTVFSDPNGSKVQDGTEVGASGGLKAVLLDATGVVIQVQTVAADGTYQFTGVATPVVGSPYTVLVTTTAPVLGTSNPVITLPAGYVSTGENKKNTIDPIVDTRVSVSVTDFISLASQPLITEAAGINFGIERLPTAVGATATSQPNPGGTTTVSVPPALFNTSTDPDGTVTSYKITAFPANATSITIDGVVYTTTAQTGTTAFPAGGVTVLATKLNTIKVDPIDGAVNVTIPFKAIDNAGQESTLTANAIVPFTVPTTFAVSGNVFDDGNGTKLKDGTGSAENYTAADITAVLLNGTGQVIGTAPIDALGNYSLANVPAGNYTVKIIKTPTTPLALNATIPPAVDVLPANFVPTGENVGNTAAGIDAVVDRTVSVTVTTANVTGINFGIEQLPTAVGTTATSQTNPGGTTAVNVPPALFTNSTDPDGTVTSYKITKFPANATSITIGATTYTAANFPPAGVTVPATALNTIKVDPIDGATTVTIPFKAIDNAGQESSNTSNALLPFTAPLSVSGNVFNDIDGNRIKATGESPVDGPATGALKAYLIDPVTQKVVAVTSVQADGTYIFPAVPSGNYTVQITTATAIVNAPAPAITLPTNWVTTGENLNGVTGTDIADGKYSITVGMTSVTNVNFGIEQLPTAVGTTAASQTNPGGTNSVGVPPTVFNTSTDPATGTVDQYRITAFPANATSITIGATTYTAANFPPAGVTVPATALNTIKVDPIDGTTTVTIPFKAIDNAGKESSNTSTASIPFTAPLSISGNVFDDGNGTKLKDGTGSAENYTAADITAVLLDGAGKVVGTAAIDALGNYNLANVPAGNYTVKIIKTPTTPLVLNAIIPTAADVLPANFVPTGENVGNTAAGIDAVVDRTVSVKVTTANVTGINFGIEQLPTAVGATATSQTNPGGTTAVNVPPALFTNSTDPDGTVNSYRITAFPANATSITIGATTYTAANFPPAGVTVLATNLNTIKVDPIDGTTTVTIPFKAIDNAGQESSNTSNASLPFTPQLSVSGNVFDDGNGSKLKDGTGSAENYTAADITAVLLDGGGKVVGTAPIDALGNYSLANVPAGSYTVKIIKTPTTPLALNATIPPAVDVLPANFVPTGENVGNTAAGIDTVVDRTVSVTVTTANVTGINFGIEQLPTAVGTTATSQTNPGGTTAVNVPPALFTNSTDPDGTVNSYRITAFPANATSITIGATTYTAANFPPAGVTILATNLNTIKVDPIDGTITVTIPFKAIDNAGQESSNTSTASLPFTAPLSISGNVFDDGNGTKLKDGTGSAENYTAADITAVLLNGTGQVIGTAPIDALGNYNLANVPAGNYTVKIIKTPTTPLVLNATIPTAADVLPTNFVVTGENVGNTAAGIDAVADRTVSVKVTTANVTGINFGIEQLPTAVGATATSQTNPGGTMAVSVPPALFTNSTDPDGTVTNYKITAFPANATSITIGATTYTAANFPPAGVTVPATALNTIKVDPIDGATTVTIPFKAIDNAGQESSNTSTASLPFGAALKPELLLVKRITAINGSSSNPNDNTPLNQFVDDTTSPKAAEDNNPNWPTGSLIGAINGGAVKTGNTIEYTIYMLSSGNTPAKNVLVCDRVPADSVFKPDGYANGRGILFNIGGISSQITNVPDNDAGQYFSPGSNPAGTYPNINCGGPNTNGAIVIKVGDLTNATTPTTPNSFSFFKFRAVVK